MEKMEKPVSNSPFYAIGPPPPPPPPDGTFNYLPSLKKLGFEHFQSQQYGCFNIKWAWSKIFEFSKFDDGILEQVSTVCHLQSKNPLI